MRTGREFQTGSSLVASNFNMEVLVRIKKMANVSIWMHGGHPNHNSWQWTGPKTLVYHSDGLDNVFKEGETVDAGIKGIVKITKVIPLGEDSKKKPGVLYKAHHESGGVELKDVATKKVFFLTSKSR